MHLPQTTLPTIGTEEIATLLHIKPATFRRRLPDLYKSGFPRPLAHCRSAWSRALVLAWIDNREPAEAAAPPHDAIADAQKALDERLAKRRAA